MKRQHVSFALAIGLLAGLPAVPAAAVELPIRKAGLWEMKTMRTGSPMPEMPMQHCTDAATDKEMSSSFSPASKEMCSKKDIQKTATGYVSDSVCSVAGMSMKSHAEIVGDFNSAYTVKSPSHAEGGAAGSRDTTMTIEAKWLGACKSDQKPGDIIMPGCMKMNVKDMEKLKGLLLKQNVGRSAFDRRRAPEHVLSHVERTWRFAPPSFQSEGLTAWSGAVLLVLAHATAKAAMFLSAGAMLRAAAHDGVSGIDGTAQALPVTTFAFALAGVSLIGLPPTGGFAAKWLLLNAALASGQWWWALVLIAGSLLAAAYTFRVLAHAFTRLPGDPPPCACAPRLEWSALALAGVALALGFVASDALDLLRVGTPVEGPVLMERAR